MSDRVPMPSVITTIRIGNFTLYAYAYRNLTRYECELAKREYLRQSKLKTVPASGFAKVFTQFGSNPADYP